MKLLKVILFLQLFTNPVLLPISESKALRPAKEQSSWSKKVKNAMQKLAPKDGANFFILSTLGGLTLMFLGKGLHIKLTEPHTPIFSILKRSTYFVTISTAITLLISASLFVKVDSCPCHYKSYNRCYRYNCGQKQSFLSKFAAELIVETTFALFRGFCRGFFRGITSPTNSSTRDIGVDATPQHPLSSTRDRTSLQSDSSTHRRRAHSI